MIQDLNQKSKNRNPWPRCILERLKSISFSKYCMYSRHSSDFCWADNIFVRPVELNFKFKKIFPYFRNSDNWRNKQQLDQCKIPSDGVLIGSGTFATILGGIIIWNPWSNESTANLEDSACTECCYSSQYT